VTQRTRDAEARHSPRTATEERRRRDRGINTNCTLDHFSIQTVDLLLENLILTEQGN
jgi:hypothetical protein